MIRSKTTPPLHTMPRTICTFCACLALLAGCSSRLPSSKIGTQIRLPVPALGNSVEPATPEHIPERLSIGENGDNRVLTARRLVTLTFDMHPDIRSSYLRFRSEEARYDFFFVSRDSLTPGISISNNYSEDRADGEVSRERSHAAEFSVEKRFFDTTKMDVGVGYRADEADEETGYKPFASASIRYPLWASRERLERTSEEIFRRNELNDAQLDYVRLVRSRIASALYKYHDLVRQTRTVSNSKSWHEDLLELASKIDQITDRDVSEDREKVSAEINRTAASVGVQEGWHKVQTAHMKLAAGLPFDARVELEDEPFNPFKSADQQELLKASLATDPEISTLRNAMENAQAQLDLARRGRWDIILRLSGQSDLEGRGAAQNKTDWSASAAIEVSAVDSRVTTSLIKQAEANIGRFQQAIIARENAIFVDTLEPLIRLKTVGDSRDELVSNLPRYVEDYRLGVEEYLAGRLNIDDLLERREDLFNRQQTISQQTYLLGANVTQLCTATGKFFELLDKHIARTAALDEQSESKSG